MAIQFVGRKSVVDAFKSRSIDTWGLFEGKNFMCGGNGAEALDQFLQRLEPSGTAAIYKLKVYRGEADPDELTDKTECNGSFNFRLTNGSISGDGAGGGGYAGIMARLDEMENRIGGTDDDADEDDITSIILGYLKEPQKLATVIGAFRSLAPGSPMQTFAPATVGAFNEKKYEMPGNMSDEEKINRLSAAIDRLEKKDADIINHLEKLATLAETNGVMFSFLLKQLDGI